MVNKAELNKYVIKVGSPTLFVNHMYRLVSSMSHLDPLVTNFLDHLVSFTSGIQVGLLQDYLK